MKGLQLRGRASPRLLSSFSFFFFYCDWKVLCFFRDGTVKALRLLEDPCFPPEVLVRMLCMFSPVRIERRNTPSLSTRPQMSVPSAGCAAGTGILWDVGSVQLVGGSSRKGLKATSSPAPWRGVRAVCGGGAWRYERGTSPGETWRWLPAPCCVSPKLP